MSFRGLIDDPSPLSLIKLCLFSFDIRHMPQGCATWPAAWETLESDWPDSGEIDIVEGVNDVSPNHVTLHSSPNCTMPTGLKMTGYVWFSQDMRKCLPVLMNQLIIELKFQRIAMST